MTRPLTEWLRETPYAGYLYSYPHKTSYRRIEPAEDLGRLWAGEDRQRLFLYAHVPYCEMRCGFCNLFTTTNPREDAVEAFLAALERQARVVKEAIGEARFARLAIGGGTPTLLDVRGLARVLDVAERTLGESLSRIPVSVESSPQTATADKLKLLRDRGVDRISIGVQSFFEDEARSVYRPQTRAEVERALGAIKEFGFPTLNVDLMYGIEGQDEARWLSSIDAALGFAPQELYLYPLYVRPLTGLGRSSRAWDDQRVALYRAGRAHLLARGWTQVSMRMFRAPGAPGGAGSSAPDGADAPVYHCQEDGMVGLGAGARSYTERLHYSTEWAVGASGVKEILRDYVARDEASFARADWGVRLDDEDRRRRWTILSLLAEGIDGDAYRARFGSELRDDLPQLDELVTEGMAAREGAWLRLTEAGVERSDTIGPWLCSARVSSLMESYALR